MNDKCIINLHNHKTAQDAATKNYVDTRYIKNNTGFIPELCSNEKNKSGFIVSANSELNTEKRAYNVFNSRRGRTDWCVSESNRDFWIQLQCPEKVKIHKFALRGNNANDKIFRWKLQASNDNNVWDNLYVEDRDKFFDETLSFFNVSPSIGYIYYRVYVTRFGGNNPGLGYWQLYTYDPIE